MKIKLLVFLLTFTLMGCSTVQKTTPEINDLSLQPLVKEPYFESVDYALFDDPDPTRCLRSFDVEGQVCTEKMWRDKLDNLCNADQIDVEYAKTCIWKQFEYCDEFGYWGEYDDETKLVSKEDVYKCTNYLILKEG
jgi:hypothetical protein